MEHAKPQVPPQPPINWIDFLLNETLLLPYLQQSSQTAIVELLDNFIRNFPGTQGEGRGFEKKRKILNTLAFRTAAFLNWNLDAISALNIGSQFRLMKSIQEVFGGSIFLKSLYHRWVLKICTFEIVTCEDQVALSSVSSTTLQDSFNALKTLTEDLEIQQQRIASLFISIPTFSSIFYDNVLDTKSQSQIPLNIFHPILYLDLGVFALRSTEIRDSVAVEFFSKLKLYNMKSTQYCNISEAKLQGYFKLGDICQPNECEMAKLGELNEPEIGYKKQREEFILAHSKPEVDSTLKTLAEFVKEPYYDFKYSIVDELKIVTDSIEMDGLIDEAWSNNSFSKPILRLFSSSSMPNSLRTTIMQLDPGIQQDYLYIPCVKAYQLFEMKCFDDFEACLESIQFYLRKKINEVGRTKFSNKTLKTFRRLDTIIEWEIVLGNCSNILLKWDLPELLFKEELVKSCTNCVNVFQCSTSDVRPRADVVETVLLTLINLECFEPVLSCYKSCQKWPFLEFLTILGRICIKFKEETYTSSYFRDFWNAILPLITTNTGVRRRTHTEGILANLSVLKWVLERSRNRFLVKLFLSLFVKLHNFVATENSEPLIEVDLLYLWPNFLDDVSEGTSAGSRVSGSSKLNSKLISEFLLTLLEAQRGLDSVKWQIVQGNVLNSAKKPFLAMQKYVEYYAQMTRGFEQMKPGWTDSNHNLLISCMIKCSYLLGCYLQGAILCQFLTEPDYRTAFGMVTDSINSIEAWEALFEFIWDQNILEYIANFYSKRKNFADRKNAAIKMLKQLELNAHNDFEIKREAVKIREIQFMRTLTNIYLME